MSLKLNVVAGQKRELVGTIAPQVGMLTSAGVISRVTEQTVYFGDAARRNLTGITVRHTEARKYGYPNSKGSVRYKVRTIRRAGVAIAA